MFASSCKHEETIGFWAGTFYWTNLMGPIFMLFSVLLMMLAAVNYMYLKPGENHTGGCLVICVPFIAVTAFHYIMTQQVLRSESASHKLPPDQEDKSKDMY